MAIYSRQDSSSQPSGVKGTAEAKAPLPSMDLSSVIVKSLATAVQEMPEDDAIPVTIAETKAKKEEERQLGELLKSNNNQAKEISSLQRLLIKQNSPEDRNRGVVAASAQKTNMDNLLKRISNEKDEKKVEEKDDKSTKKLAQVITKNHEHSHTLLEKIRKTTDSIHMMGVLKTATLIGTGVVLLEQLPRIVGNIALVINNIPVYWKEAKLWMRQTFTGSDSVFAKAGRWLKSLLNSLGRSMSESTNPILSGIGGALYSATGGTITKKVKLNKADAIKEGYEEDWNNIVNLFEPLEKEYGIKLFDEQGNLNFNSEEALATAKKNVVDERQARRESVYRQHTDNSGRSGQSVLTDLLADAGVQDAWESAMSLEMAMGDNLGKRIQRSAKYATSDKELDVNTGRAIIQALNSEDENERLDAEYLIEKFGGSITDIRGITSNKDITANKELMAAADAALKYLSANQAQEDRKYIDNKMKNIDKVLSDADTFFGGALLQKEYEDYDLDKANAEAKQQARIEKIGLEASEAIKQSGKWSEQQMNAYLDDDKQAVMLEVARRGENISYAEKTEWEKLYEKGEARTRENEAKAVEVNQATIGYAGRQAAMSAVAP